MSTVTQMRDVWARARSEHQKQFEMANQLSRVDPELARSMVEGGPASEDQITVSKVSVSASQLKPSQTTMVLAKSLGMALFMLKTGKVGGDLGAILSSDNFIMDGHHRWSAAVIAGGKAAKVGGLKAGISGEKLVRVLNIITKGVFGRNRGNAGSGNLSDYTPAKTRRMLEKFTKDGIPGQFPWAAVDVREVLEKNFGSVANGIQRLSANTGLIPTSTPSWAPNRVDMPVINPDEVPAAARVMQRGEVDWTNPYRKAATAQMLHTWKKVRRLG